MSNDNSAAVVDKPDNLLISAMAIVVSIPDNKLSSSVVTLIFCNTLSSVVLACIPSRTLSSETVAVNPVILLISLADAVTVVPSIINFFILTWPSVLYITAVELPIVPAWASLSKLISLVVTVAPSNLLSSNEDAVNPLIWLILPAVAVTAVPLSFNCPTSISPLEP